METHTTIVIPTYHRDELLERCLRSCEALRVEPSQRWDVLVVDNSAEKSAEAQVLRRSFPVALRYCHEPTPGISAARNRGVALCKGRFVAFLDDDQAAQPDWLAELHRIRRTSHADAVFGRVDVVLPEKSMEWAAPLLARSVGRDLESPEGLVAPRLVARLGTGNSLFDTDWLSGDQTFDPALGLSGGEDSFLISNLLERGATLAWAPTASVDEWVPEQRASLRFLLERRFSSGQLRTYQEARRGQGPVRVLGWMLAGAAQAAIGGSMAIGRVALGRDGRSALCDAAAGAGKVLWFDGLRVQRYRRTAPQPRQAGSAR
jgi:succinoglycan biosynthesis protein ExoM